MIKNSVTIDEVVQFLNEVTEIDQSAMTALLETRVPCNQALADHPTVQVQARNDQNSVGFLGLLNGLFGVFDEGHHKDWGDIVAVYSGTTSSDKQCIKFVRSEALKDEPKEF